MYCVFSGYITVKKKKKYYEDRKVSQLLYSDASMFLSISLLKHRSAKNNAVKRTLEHSVVCV